MQKHEDNLATQVDGAGLVPMPGVTVTVIDQSTGLAAALYSDNGVTPITTPIVTDNTGYYGFFAADGRYTITFTNPRIVTFTRDVILEDPKDNPYATLAQLAAPTGATNIGNGTESVADSFNALQLADYTALRAYTGPRKSVYVTGYLGTAAPSGIAGMFTRDDADTAVLGTPVNAAFSVAPGTLAAGTYAYRVSAIDAYGETLASTETSLAIPAQLPAPTNAPFSTAITGGSLAGGTYYYRVSATNSVGETLASTETSIVTANLAATTLSAPTTATTGGSLAAATYYYKVTALGASGETLGSNEASIATTGTTSTVSLSWAAVTGATGYRVYRGTAAGAENVYYAPGNVTSFTDTGGANTAGSPPASNTATTNTNTVTINWSAVAGATGYKVYGRGTGTELLIASVGNVTTYSDTGSVMPAGALPTTNTTSGGVTVAWASVANATGYKIYGRAAGAELFMAKVGSVTTWTDNGLITPAGALPNGYHKDNGGTVIEASNGKRWKRAQSTEVNLYQFENSVFQGNCIAAMNAALASGASVIRVPDFVTLGQHVITSPNITILGGRGVTFDNAVAAAGFQIGNCGRVEISGFVNASLKTYPDTGGDINSAHVFVGLAGGAVIDEIIIKGNSISGGRTGISVGFENGRTLNKRCEIYGNICANQNGGQGGEGYAFHYANENDSGVAFIAHNTAIEAGRHSFYIARNKSAAVTLVGNKAVRHRQNSSTKGTDVRAAFMIVRSSNITGYGNEVDGFYDSAMMFGEEGEAVANPLNADSIRFYGTILRNPNNVTAAVWTGYTNPSTTATINGVLLDGLTFDSSLSGSQVFQYSWGRGVRIRNLDIIYRNLTSGSRMMLFQGNSVSNSSNLSVENVNVHLLNCAGTFSIMRPVAPFATSNMPLKVRDVKVVTNSGGATVNDWEPSVTMTNTELDVFGFSFPSASTASPKQAQFPSGISTLVGSATWDPASIAAGARAVFNVTVTGASFGDFCVPSFSLSQSTMSMTAAVEANDTVTVCLTNNSGAPVDLASGTVRVLVIKRN